MTIRIVADSSCEMNDQIIGEGAVDLVPFKLYIDGVEYIDDASLDVDKFVRNMMASADLPRSACPSPNDFIEKFQGAEEVFVVTISSMLSGTYNSAELAKNLYLEEHPQAKVHVFDSKAASVAETLIALMVQESLDMGLAFDEVVERVEEYIAKQRTLFIAESLDNLMKNGRISKLKGRIATALNIKPIMGATQEGEIVLIEKSRGSKKAFKRLAQMVCESVENPEQKTLAISHCANPERAELLRKDIEALCSFKSVIIIQTAGLSSLYVDNMGIIVSF